MHTIKNGDDQRPPGNGHGGTKPISGMARRVNKADTSDPSHKGVGVVLWSPKDNDRMEDKGACSDVLMIPSGNDMRKSSLVVVDGLRPRQVLAASLLVQGRRGKDVAGALGVSAETVSRWRQLPAFEALMHRMLLETIDTAKVGMVSLCAESVEHLRGLLHSFSDKTVLKAITLILNKVGPVLGVVGTELRRPSDSQTK